MDPEPITAQFAGKRCAPKESDSAPADYLNRCKAYVWGQYAYPCTVSVYRQVPSDSNSGAIHALQISIPDFSQPGGQRVFVAVAPDHIIDTGDGFVAMTPEESVLKYGPVTE